MDAFSNQKSEADRLMLYPSGWEFLSRKAAIFIGLLLFSFALSSCALLDRIKSSIGSSSPGQHPTGLPGPRNELPSVALLLSSSMQGIGGKRARAFSNAARLAISEWETQDIRIIIKDDLGTPAGAAIAARQALAEGAQAILGPVFASQVAAVSEITRPLGVPVIAFSSDKNVAAPGVYLLSFLPNSEVERIVSYTLDRGRRSFAALVPDTAYGSVVEGVFRQSVNSGGGRVLFVERYPVAGDDFASKVHQIASFLRGGQADALFIPDTGSRLQRILQELSAAKVDLGKIQLIGTGLWDDDLGNSTPSKLGGWYAAPDRSGFEQFAYRYQLKFGEQPMRIATLAYDAVHLIGSAIREQRGGGKIISDDLTNPLGFSGADGIFRFLADGLSERGLAIYQVESDHPRLISPAPEAFADAVEKRGGHPELTLLDSPVY